MLHLSDDGIGMTEREVRDLLSLGYTRKRGSHYGMGATTSMPAIAEYALVFSCRGGHCTVGCLSSKLNLKL